MEKCVVLMNDHPVIRELDRMLIEWQRRVAKTTRVRRYLYPWIFWNVFFNTWVKRQWQRIIMKNEELKALIKVKQDALEASNRQWLDDHGYTEKEGVKQNES